VGRQALGYVSLRDLGPRFVYSDLVIGGEQMDFGADASRDIAVHESGHAVARVLSIGRVGITNETLSDG
jgi:hypothetical protein